MVNNTNLVSVVMATYNGEYFLKEQLDSVLAQTYDNIEIIIVDDSSVDSTLSIIESYIAKYECIKLYVNEKNLGVAKSFERGISFAKGDFISFCDQDDFWLPNKIEILVNNIGQNLLIHSDAFLVDEKLNIIKNSLTSVKGRIRNTFAEYLFGNDVTGCTAMISKKCIEIAMPFPDDFFMHDHYFALVASYFNKIKYIDDKLIMYRQHSSNAVGVSRMSYKRFILMNKSVVTGYESLCKKEFFSEEAKSLIDLAKNYRYSIVKAKLMFSVLKLVSLNKGILKLMYFYLVTGLGSPKFAEWLYDYAKLIRRKIKGLS